MDFLDGYQATGNNDFKRVVREVLDYIQRDMTAPGGAFYSATDADSLTPTGHREEGYYFTWTPTELDEVLDQETARMVKAYYAVDETPNFEGRNILHTPGPPQMWLKTLGFPKPSCWQPSPRPKRPCIRPATKGPCPCGMKKYWPPGMD